jgi:hypothetical protein
MTNPLALLHILFYCMCLLICWSVRRVRTTVLGSRNQLCLNDKVLKLPGQAANFTCRALVQHKQCRWWVGRWVARWVLGRVWAWHGAMPPSLAEGFFAEGSSTEHLSGTPVCRTTFF